jgi:hypothetical protein
MRYAFSTLGGCWDTVKVIGITTNLISRKFSTIKKNGFLTENSAPNIPRKNYQKDHTHILVVLPFDREFLL